MRTVSVIIATHNRCERLGKVLDDLLNQESNGGFRFEILVVDNNSKDQTRTVVNDRLNRIPENCLRLRYLFESRQGKPFALNRGIGEAEGEIIAFTDDDVSVDAQWLENIVQCFQEHGCDGVGGRVLPVYPDKTPRWVRKNPHQAAGAVVIYDHGGQTRRYESSMELFIGANFAFRRQVFDRCGLFRTDYKFNGLALGEDREFINRLIKAGGVLCYCGKAVVRHPVDLSRLTLKYIAKWHMALGRLAARTEMEAGGNGVVHYFGIPRYLLKGILTDALLLVPNVFNRFSLFNRLRGFFRKAGMIQEYRRLAKEKAVSCKL